MAEQHVYADDGISGAEFVKRPGFLRLMNALKPRPSFQALIMMDEDRLGREAIETAYALKQILDADVRVFVYLEDRERTLDNALDKVMLSLTNFAGEMEREKARQRTYDACQRRAAAGAVAGGRVFGYRNVRNGDGYVHRVIDEAEAAVVRRIFTMYAEGAGLMRIEGAQRRARPGAAGGHGLVGAHGRPRDAEVGRSTRAWPCGTRVRRSCGGAPRSGGSAPRPNGSPARPPSLRSWTRTSGSGSRPGARRPARRSCAAWTAG